MKALKLASVGLLAVFAATLYAGMPGGGEPRTVRAEPTNVIGLNSAICTSLGVAFAGLPSVSAISYCSNIAEQDTPDEGIQSFIRCLRGSDIDNDGSVNCTQGNDPESPLYEPGVQQGDPSDFAPLDLDKNQVHDGQAMIMIVYVDDDAPVRFTTDEGNILGVNNVAQGKEYFCETYIPTVEGDPDCDGDPATIGDGIVAARLRIDDEVPLGDHTITAVQEGLGFPMTFTVVGAPERIEITPLFGKTVIATGATDPPAPGEGALTTSCVFGASASAVLGANSQAEKVILVAKAFDDDDNEVVGALLAWEFPFKTATGAGESDIAGVALPQTPTIDTGALGIAFPQFLCGKDEPGTFTAKVRFDTVLDTAADSNEEVEYTITVIGPGENIVLTVDPPLVNCDGLATATVSAQVTTAEGEVAADGTDVDWSVQVLGTTNPLTSNTGAGKATTVVTPLSGSNRGVPVIATVGDQQASILVNCGPGGAPAPGAPAPGAPAPGGGAAPGGGRPVITGPDTGSGGDLDGRGALGVWPAVALFVGAMGLVGARYGIRRA